MIVIDAGRDGIFGAVFGSPSDRIIEGVGCSAVVVGGKDRPGRARRFLENRVF